MRDHLRVPSYCMMDMFYSLRSFNEFLIYICFPLMVVVNLCACGNPAITFFSDC